MTGRAGGAEDQQPGARRAVCQHPGGQAVSQFRGHPARGSSRAARRDRDHFAAYNGTAPVEVSSGKRKVHRMSRRGNRRFNHAVHMAAITQVRFAHSQGRAYYDKKIAEGKTPKEALRALKRRVSDAIYRQLRADARRATAASAQVTGPGGQAGNDTNASAAGSHPKHQLFGEATPGPSATLRPAPLTPQRKPSSRASKKIPRVP